MKATVFLLCLALMIVSPTIAQDDGGLLDDLRNLGSQILDNIEDALQDDAPTFDWSNWFPVGNGYEYRVERIRRDNQRDKVCVYARNAQNRHTLSGICQTLPIDTELTAIQEYEDAEQRFSPSEDYATVGIGLVQETGIVTEVSLFFIHMPISESSQPIVTLG